MKTQILAAIGETGLEARTAINAGLAANDRLKYIFSLLQMALAHARHPDQSAQTLKRERISCGIDDPALDEVADRARLVGACVKVQRAAGIIGRIRDDLRLMAAPILAATPDGLAARLDGLLVALPVPADDLLDCAVVEAMMRAAHDGPDSPHRLVMDLHKLLNAQQASLAEESLDGAAVYGLAPADRATVSAFMAGINRLAKLKFSHPGLATTATRIGDRLVIQNDIGTTDAHVIVIHVLGNEVSVTYTDVHIERVTFFQDMLKSSGMIWDTTRSATLPAGESFTLIAGHVAAKDEAGCRQNLEFLASRLVFLIDWNRARKELRGFLRGPDRVNVLRRAADAEIGHRGFLEMGGAKLVNQAIEASAGSAMHFGDRLCDVLGDAETQSFLSFVLRACTEGLLAGQSCALIHDRIRVTLATHFSNGKRHLLDLAQDHAGLIFELACLVRDGLRGDPADAPKRVRRAAKFEQDADQLVIETRKDVRRRPEHAVFLSLIEGADDIADALEDAAFLIDLDHLTGKPLVPLQNVADLLVESAQEWIKAIGHATQIGSVAANAEDFLMAFDRIGSLERHADESGRALTEAAMKHAEDFRQLHLFSALATRLDEAVQALKHASLGLRDLVLEGFGDA